MKQKTRKIRTLEELFKDFSIIHSVPLDQITVSTHEPCGDTPLHTFALHGDRQAVLTLLKADADVNAKGDLGLSPLYYAVMNNHVLVAEVLLEHGANPYAKSEPEFSLETVKEYALRKGNKEMVKLFNQRFKP